MWTHQYDLQYLPTWLGWKMTRGFNDEVKSLLTFNNPDIFHRGFVRKQQTGGIEKSAEEISECHGIVTIYFESFTTGNIKFVM